MESLKFCPYLFETGFEINHDQKRLRHLLPFLSCILWRQNSNTIRDYHENEEEEEASNSVVFPSTCSEGHRSTLLLRTKQGGSICLLCFSNLISNRPRVLRPLSALSGHLLRPTPFLRSLLAFHPHFLLSLLVHALSSFDDDPIARQVVHLISALCDSAAASISADFVARVSDRLSSGALAWSGRQLYTLLHLSLEALMKTQRNEVRLNCVAFLTVLAQTRRGLFGAAYAVDLNSMSSSEGDSFEQAT
ncbi:protein PRD1-like [Prunus avium]|uniref:Protein PRD1-like n=1 Tax=Prunus avium TaxID=42229 RepID=A0A6P5RPG5_PRUAV|nr:protein PRD1-like [Prunus avium]